MKNTNPAWDAYIEKAPAFARPILEELRAAFHKACPDIREEMKWSSPAFVQHSIVAVFSAHKAHVRFGFWKMEALSGADDTFEVVGKTAMGLARFESLKDLPPKRTLNKWIREALAYDAAQATGAQDKPKPAAKKKSAKKAGKRPEAAVPDDLAAALAQSAKARKTFEGFSPSNRREYVEWITEAKREATRTKRLEQAIEWMAEGKPRNWKYMKTW